MAKSRLTRELRSRSIRGGQRGRRSLVAVCILRALGGCDILTPRITARYSDVPADYWARKEIEYLSGSMNASGGIVVTGYGDGTYHPTETVLRDAMAVFIARGFVVPQ